MVFSYFLVLLSPTQVCIHLKILRVEYHYLERLIYGFLHFMFPFPALIQYSQSKMETEGRPVQGPVISLYGSIQLGTS